MNMPTLREMQEKREQLVTQARAALDEIKGNTDDNPHQELEQRHDTIMGELDTLDAQIAREERVAAAERSQTERREREVRGRRPIDRSTTPTPATPEGHVEYRDAFYAYIRCQGQEALLPAEQRAVLQRGYQAIPAEQRAQTTTNAAGGYTVPVELQAEIIKSMKAFGPMYDPGVTRELVTSGGYSLPFPTVDDTANSAAASTQGTTLPTTARATSCSARRRSAPSRSRRLGCAFRRSSPTTRCSRWRAARRPARRAPRPPGEQPADRRRRHHRAAGHRGRLDRGQDGGSDDRLHRGRDHRPRAQRRPGLPGVAEGRVHVPRPGAGGDPQAQGRPGQLPLAGWQRAAGRPGRSTAAVTSSTRR
jgi:hypothetical protein